MAILLARFTTQQEHAFGVDDSPLISFLFSLPFSEWVTSADLYWSTLAKRRRSATPRPPPSTAACSRAAAKWIDGNLFNGEYSVQQIRGVAKDKVAASLRSEMGSEDTVTPPYQMCEGCLADQLIGQYLADVAGLPVVAERLSQTGHRKPRKMAMSTIARNAAALPNMIQLIESGACCEAATRARMG